MADEWTPLDDVGRSIEAIKHGLRRVPDQLARVEAARLETVGKLDAFLAALTAGSPDASDLTDAEAEEMAKALDTIYRVRDLLDPPASRDADRGETDG